MPIPLSLSKEQTYTDYINISASVSLAPNDTNAKLRTF